MTLLARSNVQVYGSFEALKEAIARDYQSKLSSSTFEADQRMLEMEECYRQQVRELHTEYSKKISEKANEHYESVFLQGHRKLRDEYERFREELLESAMNKLKEALKKKTTTKGYISFAKKQIKGKKVALVEGHSSAYKKSFRKFKKVQGILGLRITCKQEVIDLTVDRLFSLEKDSIREELYRALFKRAKEGNGNES